MFDSTPPNLPVEPKGPIPTPMGGSSVPAPAAPSPASSPSPIPMVSKGKKEPEDIFSGMDQGGSGSKPEMPSMDDEPRSGPPIKLIAALIGGVILISVAGYAVWTFVLKPSSAPAPVAVPATPSVPEVVEQPPVIDQGQQPVTQPPNGVNIPAPQPITPPAQPPPETPPSASIEPSTPIEGLDTDSDGLTDAEEAYYGAEPVNKDTDGDGYTDGSEVSNLFSPVAKDKALTAEPYALPSSWKGWSFLIVKPWSVVQELDTAYVTTGSANRFRLALGTNPTRQPLADWIGPDKAEGMTTMKTKGGLFAMQSVDGLTTYVASGDMVLIVTYDLNGESMINYRTSYQMLLNSLRPPSP